jgi:tryptophanyl-tRNA synthetase
MEVSLMKRMVSGIKPTGQITLGNYLGAIKQFIKYQDEYDLLVFIADLHALTLPIDPKELKQNTEDLIAIYLACGLDPMKCKIFKQSQVPGHTDLNWVLTCNSNLGDLTKMPQYKNYIAEHGNEGVPSGMLMYPALMSADILLYDADLVPVGADQMSHIELCKDLAERFNKRYPGTFKLPSGVLSKSTSKIMSLSNPTRKMSKSESDKGTIYLLDDIEISKKKIMKAVTDSENAFYYNPETKPGLSNLISIYSALSGQTIDEVVAQYKETENYGVFKRALCELLEKELAPIQEKVQELKATNYCERILDTGAAYARHLAAEKLGTVYKKVGIF